MSNYGDLNSIRLSLEENKIVDRQGSTQENIVNPSTIVAIGAAFLVSNLFGLLVSQISLPKPKETSQTFAIFTFLFSNDLALAGNQEKTIKS